MTKKMTLMALATALLFASLLGTAEVRAQATSVDQLTFPPLKPFDIPEPSRVTLKNGMVVLLLEDHELPLVDAIALIRTGSRLEPADKAGLAELTGSVLRTGGTTSMSGDDLDDFLEAKAASIETSIDTESGSARMSSLKKDFPEVFRVFAQVLRSPVFDAKKIDVAKTQAEATISRQNDNPQGILFREFSQIIYGEDSPYTRDTTYASLASIERQDLVDWHAKYLHPNRVVLGLVGDFNSKEALGLIREVFGDWKKGPADKDPVAAYDSAPKPGVFYVAKNDMTQSNIAMGHIGTRRDNPDYYALELVNQVMSGSFASRLFSNVRSKKGLAYSVRGAVNSRWDHEGTTQFWMTTKVETTGAGIEALLEEARNMTALPPTEEEVEKAKAGILNSFIFNVDSPREILNQQLLFEYYGYPLDWLSRYQKGIAAVTTDQVRKVAAKYIHPDQFSILVVGPEEGRDKPLSDFGQVTEVDITIPEPEVEKAEVTDEGAQQGQMLLAKALDGFGGSERVDSLKSLVTRGTLAQKTPQGELEIQVTSTFLFPGKVRQDLTLPFGTMSLVLTDESAFMMSPQGSRDLPESQKAIVGKSITFNPLNIVRSRDEDGFRAVALGPGEVEGTAVEEVQVEMGGDVATVSVDPETGHVLQLRYQGSTGGGPPGEIIQVYRDFQEVDGLTYPMTSVGQFNGDQVSNLSLETVEVDPDLDPSLFSRPDS